MTALSPAEADALYARERRRMAATEAVNKSSFTVRDVPGGFSPGPVHGGALTGWRHSGPDLRATLRVDAVGWRGGSGPAADVEVLVPRYASDPPEAWESAAQLARLNAGGA